MLRSLYTLIIACSLVPSVVFATGFVDTPDQCYGLEKITKTNINLKPISKCEGKPGRLFLEANPGDVRQVFVNGDFWSEQKVKAMETVDVSALGEKVKEFSDKIKVPENPYKKVMTEAATRVKDTSESEEFKTKVAAETQRIGENTLGERFTKYYKDNIDVTSISKLKSDDRVYVFISESMPMHVLRQYAADMARLDDPQIMMVMRGFVGGVTNIGPTAGLLAKITVKDTTCDLAGGADCPMMVSNVIIDPLLFRRFNVTNVPTFVYASGVKLDTADQSEGRETNAKIDSFYSISGDVSLKYVFKQIGEAAGEEWLVRADLP